MWYGGGDSGVVVVACGECGGGEMVVVMVVVMVDGNEWCVCGVGGVDQSELSGKAACTWHRHLFPRSVSCLCG